MNDTTLYASVVTVYTLSGDRSQGRPLVTMGTLAGFAADVFIHDVDGNAVQCSQLNTAAAVLDQMRRMRRLAQDNPQDFVTINVTRGHATLVA